MELVELFTKGGFVMYLLLLSSIAVVGIGIERLNFYNYADNDGKNFLSALNDKLKNNSVDEVANFCHAEKTALEISPKNISKASGLKELCDFLKINLSETVAVGDAPNDTEILKTAGLAVAMGNATAEIKNLANFVTDDNDHDGIVKVIEKFF